MAAVFGPCKSKKKIGISKNFSINFVQNSNRHIRYGFNMIFITFEKAWSPPRKGERDLSRRLHAVLTTQYTRASVGDTFDDNQPPTHPLPPTPNPPTTCPQKSPFRKGSEEEDGDNGEVADCVSIHPSRRFPLSIMINFEFPIYGVSH